MTRSSIQSCVGLLRTQVTLLFSQLAFFKISWYNTITMDRTLFRCNVALSIIALLWLPMIVFTPPISMAEWVIRHAWFPDDSSVQSYVQYAYDISWWDRDFITTLEAENWLWNPHRQSEVFDKRVGKREDSRWFCQLHRNRHSNIVDDPRFFSDPYRQLDRCLEKYRGWTKFYWYYVRHWLEKRFALDWKIVSKSYPTMTEKKPERVQKWNPYIAARQKQDELDSLRSKMELAEKEAKQLRQKCISSWECTE